MKMQTLLPHPTPFFPLPPPTSTQYFHTHTLPPSTPPGRPVSEVVAEAQAAQFRLRTPLPSSHSSALQDKAAPQQGTPTPTHPTPTWAPAPRRDGRAHQEGGLEGGSDVFEVEGYEDVTQVSL